jgi:NAD(P)-dependent dehydrogenase (short-subunit alcohol dehydrogenase family)
MAANRERVADAVRTNEPELAYDEQFYRTKEVLTGACGVLGRWIADAFARIGARLCLSASRESPLSRLGAELGVAAHGGIVHATELTNAASMDALVAAVGAAWALRTSSSTTRVSIPADS